MKYEAGPFTTFGTKILMNYAEETIDGGFNIKVTPYIPDFSVKPLTDVTLLYIPLKHYIVALKGSCAEKDAEIIFEEVSISVLISGFYQCVLYDLKGAYVGNRIF